MRGGFYVGSASVFGVQSEFEIRDLEPIAGSNSLASYLSIVFLSVSLCTVTVL